MRAVAEAPPSGRNDDPCWGLSGGEDAVGDGGGFGGGADVVDAEDVGSGEDGRCVGCGGGVEAGFYGGECLVQACGERGALEHGAGEEAFAGDSGEDGAVELVELVQVGQQRVVFVEALAEAEAWVEDDFVVGDACGCGGFEAGFECGEDERENLVFSEWGLVRPVLGAASGVHQDGSTP